MPWLCRDEERDDASLRLFCFPYGGGSAREYASWSADLPESIEVVAIELPGHGARRAEPALESMALLLDGLEAELRDETQSWLGKPFAFFGHSAGAIIAFALALRMRLRGDAMPRRLFLSASAAPLGGAHSDGLPDGWRTDDAAFVAAVKEWGGVPPDEELMADPSAIALLFSALRCDMAVMTSFESLSEADWSASVAQGKLGCAVSLLAGAADQVVPASAMARWLELSAASESKAPEVRVIEGDHFFWKEGGDGRAQTLGHVAALLQEDIKAAAADAVASIERWNSGSEPWPSQKLLHELFVDSAAKTPDAVAVFDGTTGSSMTYAELDRRSELLARYLYQKGVMVESITGILMEHCVEYVIAYIAALKAGGAYMPLETAYPADLLSRVLTATPIAVVLTKKAFADRLPKEQRHFCMDADWLDDMEHHEQPVDRLVHRIVPDRDFEDREKPTPHSSAFVVMSSGTTGTPKGIVQVHRAAVHSYSWRLRHYPFVPGDRVACHVFFVWELLRPLLNGTGTPMYVIPDEVIYDPGPLLTFLEEHAITRTLFTPSLCQLLLDSFSAAELNRRLGSTLTLVWLCGEVVTVELRNRFCTALPNCRLVSLYSISECHDVSAVNLHEPASLVNSPKYAPCGRVMANVIVKILGGEDGVNGQVPLGVPGEVYVGGPVLARGYHGQVKKTAERFVPDPEGDGTFDRHTGEGLLYRTGDRGRFLPDGQLEIIGRCDFMVKVRGYSIVLGAVEVALTEFPGIATAVVVTEGAEGTDKRLVAYVVPEFNARQPSSATLRKFLSQKLPHYAIPSVFCVLDALPVHAASGKTDRKSLPSTDADRVQRLRAYSIESEHAEHGDTPLPPSQNVQLDDTEVALRKIWCDLIGIDADDAQAIGKDTSFFDVGGHSLLAPRLVAACNKAFEGSALTLSAVLLTPALGDIAAAVSGDVQLADGDAASSKQAALADEVVLDSSISFAKSCFAPARHCQPRRVLLTGSTGYVGAYILRQLLKMAADASMMIYCLVRITDETVASTSKKVLDSLVKEKTYAAHELPSREQLQPLAEHEAGLERLREVLKSFNLWRDTDPSDDEGESVTEDMLRTHVQIVRGDLKKPLLGLTQDAFRMLGGECDAIIHSGAEVNLVKSYASLKAANVNGTHEVLRLAATNGLALHAGAKPVYFISTNGVFPTSVSEQREDANTAEFGPELEGGYAQSKWVAEQLVLKARHGGLPAAVFRLGNMAPSSTQPRWNPHDFYFLLLKACKILRATPAFGGGDQNKATESDESGTASDWWFDFTPVDFAAAAICQLAVQAPAHGIDKVVHVQNKQRAVSASTLFDWVREQDVSIRSVDLPAWKEMLQEAADGHGGNFAATDLTALRQLSAGLPSFEYYFESPAHFHNASLLEVLEASAGAGRGDTCVSCPEVDAKLTQMYFAAL